MRLFAAESDIQAGTILFTYREITMNRKNVQTNVKPRLLAASVAAGLMTMASGAYANVAYVAGTTNNVQYFSVGGGGNSISDVNNNSLGATGEKAVAIGRAVSAAGYEGVALGSVASAGGKSSIAIGASADAAGYGSAAIGGGAKSTASQATAVGNQSEASGQSSSAFGFMAKAQGVSSTAVGENSKATGSNASAFGSGASAAGNQATAIGYAAKASQDNAAAFGMRSEATGVSSTSIGADAKATGSYATALGYTAAASGNQAIALGRNSKASAANSIAIGTSAQATHANSVALGNSSVTADAVGTNSATVGNLTYGGFAGTSPVGTVSVGSSGAERTVTNVAAGRINATSTDAINGSQLYSVAQQVNTNTTNITNLGNQITNVNNNVNNVYQHVGDMDKDLRAGIAGATAIGFLQRPNEPGKSLVSAAVGGYRNQQALAVGYAHNSDNNKWSTKFGVGVNTRKDVNWGASLGYQW